MKLNDSHASLLSGAFEGKLGDAYDGAVAYARFFPSELAAFIVRNNQFQIPGWEVYQVTDHNHDGTRSIRADQAMLLREKKGTPVLFIVDSDFAGSGMDGIYSSAQEISEIELMEKASALAIDQIGGQLSVYADKAIKTSKRPGAVSRVSIWARFDFLAHVLAETSDTGSLLYLLGLWPVKDRQGQDYDQVLSVSSSFVDNLLVSASSSPYTERIKALKLDKPSDSQRRDLIKFLRNAAILPLNDALKLLADQEDIWVNSLLTQGPKSDITGLTSVPWRTKPGKLVKWSGLEDDDTGTPEFILPLYDTRDTGNYKLEIRWKVEPDSIEQGSVIYHVAVLSDLDEELASKEVTHSAKVEEKCRFTPDDFALSSDDQVIGARIQLTIKGNANILSHGPEDFRIRFGVRDQVVGGIAGIKLRTFSDGLIDLATRQEVSDLLAPRTPIKPDSNNYLVRRVPQMQSFRVFQPPLAREIETLWADRHSGAIGRWKVKVRSTGDRIGQPEFVPIIRDDSNKQAWDRAESSSRSMAFQFQDFGGSGQIYYDKIKDFDTTREYLLAWTQLLDSGEEAKRTELALANTVEIQSHTGRTYGLIVLPSHPVRVAWHVAYDNLMFHAKFDEVASPKDIRNEFNALDGAMFPAFLPKLGEGGTLLFADTLGFHYIAMVPENDKEPKATLSILSRALGESQGGDTEPGVGKKNSIILGDEIHKYIQSHDISKKVKISAMQGGDGFTVARSLGRVQQKLNADPAEEDLSSPEPPSKGFVLELYPSDEQADISGRFMTDVLNKHKRSAGKIDESDRWMVESMNLPSGVTVPRLEWYRKDTKDPGSHANISLAFDTFSSRVELDHRSVPKPRPFFSYGLINFFDREYEYSNERLPMWTGRLLAPTSGEKHPSERGHTERLSRLQYAIRRCVALSIGNNGGEPVLQTEISPDSKNNLRLWHDLSDWVITVDRNAGVEYFDSPRDSEGQYETYVIDSVPERDDLGSLQMITSTSNLDEVRNLLDKALTKMQLSNSLRNAEGLLGNLKALSGRLAMRLTGVAASTSELIALAESYGYCKREGDNSDCWVSLSKGFLIPVDDVLDLLPSQQESDSAGDHESQLTDVMARPDLVYVTVAPRRGLQFRFIEVKYRQNLSAARNSDLHTKIRDQAQSLRDRWKLKYALDRVPRSIRAVRIAKLARMLRFYADKAHRHFMPDDEYKIVIEEIDRMVEKASTYSFMETDPNKPDLGWIFCPEYTTGPLRVSPIGSTTAIFLFGSSYAGEPAGQQEEPLEAIKIEAPPGEQEPSNADQQEEPLEAIKIEAPPDEQEPSNADHHTTPEYPNNDRQSRVAIPSLTLGDDFITKEPVNWTLTQQGNPNLLIAGLPGMGKTTVLRNLCKQMMDAGVKPIVFSYHQDIDDQLLEIFDSNVRFIDFQGLDFNPLQVIKPRSRNLWLDVAASMRDIFQSIFTQLGDVQTNRIRQAIRDSFQDNGWDDKDADLDQLEEPLFRTFVDKLFLDTSTDKHMRTLRDRLEELDEYGFFDVSDNPESIWDTDKPTIIRIHKTANDLLQKAFAFLVFYGLYKDMFKRGLKDRISHAIVFDEAHKASRLKLIPTMAKECRKYGISLVLASQEAKDFDTGLFSAIANYLVLRLTDTDAKALVRNVASSDRERNLVDRIKGMDKFRAMYFTEGADPQQIDLLEPFK